MMSVYLRQSVCIDIFSPKIRLAQHGWWTCDHALLHKHWTLQHVLNNMSDNRKLIRANGGLVQRANFGLGEGHGISAENDGTVDGTEQFYEENVKD